MKRLGKKVDTAQMCVLYARNADTRRTGKFEQYIAFSDWTDHSEGPSVRFHGGTPYAGQLDNAPVMQFNIYGDCTITPSMWMNKYNCPNVFDERILKQVTHFIQRNLPVLYLVYERFLDKADALAYFEGRTSWETMLSTVYRIADDLYAGLLSCKDCAQLHMFCVCQNIYGQATVVEGRSLLCRTLENQSKPVFELSWDYYDCTLCGYNGNSTTVHIPEYVSTIGENAFRNHAEINKVIFSNAVEVVEDGAFAGCSGLEVLIIPGSVCHIGRGAFAHCTSLRSVYIEVKADWKQVLSEDAFCHCINLKEILLPESVLLEGHPFENCPQLRIVCTPGSSAAQHALENEIPYTITY